ncbi:MAG: alkaline phosphatase family protein [Phycisphaerae bacterium]|nr:alkaline phosphatase family protein [Phycisphaerae bacterium]
MPAESNSPPDSTSKYPTSPNRPLPGTAPKVMIIGLDGATFDVLGPLIEEGRLPRLAELVRTGASGILESTTPPITPAAWTTFLTGKQPGLHGILDFERYDPPTHRLIFNSTISLGHVRHLWAILSEAGFRVGSVNVPMTYPPMPVNGFVVSGFETPGPDSPFAYPAEIREDILSRWPDPTLRAKWRRSTLGGDDQFRTNLDYISRSFDQGAEMSFYLGDRFGWDVLMVVLKLVDNLQHKTWKYIDPRWADGKPQRRDAVKACFGRMDEAVGRLLDYAAEHDAAVMIVSDHGHGSLEGKVQPNLLLERWGYLRLRGGGAQEVTRVRSLADRLLRRRRKFEAHDDLARDLAVDFTQTQACVMHAGMAGFLYINLEGRQPTGVVPPSEYESLREELCERFLGRDCEAVDPQGRRIKLFRAVHKPEDLYGCSREEQPWMPDLMLTPHESLAVVRKIRGRAPVRWLPYRKLEGTHRSEGVLIAGGPGVRHAKGVRAHLADCAPTILTMLGQRVPSDMQGRVLTELFSEAPVVEKEAASSAARVPVAKAVFNEEELRQVTERLTDLGYLQ